jgi:hypothetical protein
VRWVGCVVCMREMRKREGNRALGKARYRLIDNVKRDLKDVECQDMY